MPKVYRATCDQSVRARGFSPRSYLVPFCNCSVLGLKLSKVNGGVSPFPARILGHTAAIDVYQPDRLVQKACEQPDED